MKTFVKYLEENIDLNDPKYWRVVDGGKDDVIGAKRIWNIQDSSEHVVDSFSTKADAQYFLTKWRKAHKSK